MARILSISSQVVYGHVGNSIATFVLQRFGHEVLSVPTVLLSNRPGYAYLAATPLAADGLDRMLEAASANGWFDGLDAITTGYLPTPAHVRLCADWVGRLKAARSGVFYLCDPILGDAHTGVYIDEAAARAIREELLPLCDLATPNAFELSWLSEHPIATEEDAIDAARSLGLPGVIATSAPVAGRPDHLGNCLVEGETVRLAATRKRDVQAHGTGDFFAAQFLARKLRGAPHETALDEAAAAMEIVLDASRGQDELALVPSQHLWAV